MNATASSGTQGTQSGLEELAKTGPGTPMGQLLRRFWQPIAAAAEVPKSWSIPIRILGEDLTLYRGESGAPHLVAARCAHRLTHLHVGWVEDENIRCMYHGWMYDGSGQCVEMPAEEASFADRVRIAAYPVREYCGLIFAYLGDGEPPAFELPRHPELERPDAIRWIQRQIWGCNWLQSVENSLDAAHVSFVHRWGRLGLFGAAVSDVLPKLEYLETESGIRQIATRSADNVRVSDWTFPNHNHIVVPGLSREDPWTHTFPWMVALDDGHCMRLTWQCSFAEGEAAERLKTYLLTNGYEPTQEPNTYFGRQAYDPSQHHDDLFFRRACPEPLTSELTNAQDYVAQVAQGSVVDRTRERLGQSDAGVRFLRMLLLRELAALRGGRAPKHWTRSGDPVPLPAQPWEQTTTGRGWDRKGLTTVSAG